MERILVTKRSKLGKCFEKKNIASDLQIQCRWCDSRQ